MIQTRKITKRKDIPVGLKSFTNNYIGHFGRIGKAHHIVSSRVGHVNRRLGEVATGLLCVKLSTHFYRRNSRPCSVAFSRLFCPRVPIASPVQ